MVKKTFAPTKFQQCTVNQVVEELYNKNKQGPKRFLVADEVGLGKTIIAKNVIDHLRSDNKSHTIIYVSSSLDITKQNKFKLAQNPDLEIVQADRINLVYEEGLKKSKIKIISMTPGTSLNFGTSLGHQYERIYMAALIRLILGFKNEKLARVFCGMANEDNFYNRLADYEITNRLCSKLEDKIVKRWQNIQLESGESFRDTLKRSNLDKSECRELVRAIRKEMAIAILEDINPDLVIFDEFQKFKDITEIDSNGRLSHELGKILLAPKIPVLLLSATPYKLYSDGPLKTWNSIKNTDNYNDLVRTFCFLTGDNQLAADIVGEIKEYGEKVKDLSSDNILQMLMQKEQIQKHVMEYMSRAERINFENDQKPMIKDHFLSEKLSGYDLTKENILEFMKIAQNASSRKTLLTYWKSGVSSMSYMHNYKLLENAMLESQKKTKCISKDNSLYSLLKKSPSQHIKIKYLYKEVFKEGQNLAYLWLPPTNPYYEGTSIYSQEKIAENNPQKALVFSSWVFVPKMVASELGAMKENILKKVAKNVNIEVTGPSFRRLLFPSTLLANSLSHKDFVESKSYKELVNIAAKRIRKVLEEKYCFELSESYTGNSSWEIMQYTEFTNNPEKMKLFHNYCNGTDRHRKRWHLNAGKKSEREAFSIKTSLSDNNIPLKFNKRTLESLAKAAISSPAVCFLRSIEHMRGKRLPFKQWMQLAAFGMHDIRTFINREGHSAIISKYGKGKNSVSKAADYFRIGNFQAVVDEYLYQIYLNKSEEGTVTLIKKLGQIFGPNRSRCTVRTSRNREHDRAISNDLVCCFGDGAEESNSRDLNREAFNSPFWPFALATTSVGQEGLDFHLYCNSIYHWNLPTNPVDFEQREGRLNRFNCFMVRKNIVADQKNLEVSLKEGETIWEHYFDNARKFSNLSDRYNLEMSPNWIYTPDSNEYFRFNRHILDLPCSNDKNKYFQLKKDIELYRLAIGQPNQRDFLEEIKSNEYFSRIDPRGVILNFFPFKSRDWKAELNKFFASKDEVKLLIEDSMNFLGKIEANLLYPELKVEVIRNVNRVERFIKNNIGTEEEFKRSIEALYYFLDPFDELCDRDPEIGFSDDLAKLKAA
ncbi:DEAD/DEAH box helicase [Halobacteriovorax sp. HLS]|uniref:DEAD/DEAH box helicase n=1 Tax=Halobacteriovorax sp. HLS TaxID=2234000 RepID=UPI0013E3B1BF|nr:DEAD/DEAH box helicase [Halobacteriovorax sp. HLS]